MVNLSSFLLGDFSVTIVRKHYIRIWKIACEKCHILDQTLVANALLTLGCLSPSNRKRILLEDAEVSVFLPMLILFILFSGLEGRLLTFHLLWWGLTPRNMLISLWQVHLEVAVLEEWRERIRRLLPRRLLVEMVMKRMRNECLNSRLVSLRTLLSAPF